MNKDKAIGIGLIAIIIVALIGITASVLAYFD